MQQIVKIRRFDIFYINYENYIHKFNNYFFQALFYAVKANRYEIVEVLLYCNAEISIKDRFGDMPYDIAKTKGYDKVITIHFCEKNFSFSLLLKKVYKKIFFL